MIQIEFHAYLNTDLNAKVSFPPKCHVERKRLIKKHTIGQYSSIFTKSICCLFTFILRYLIMITYIEKNIKGYNTIYFSCLT